VPTSESAKTLWLETALVFAAAFVVRAAVAQGQALWDDEIASRIVALTPLPDLLRGYYRVDPHPPLFHLLLKAWIALTGASDEALRLLPQLLGAATVAAAFRTAARFADRTAARLGAYLLALTPLLVWAGTELRGFALLALLLVGATHYALAWRERQARAGIFMTLCLTASLYTHYYAFFFVGAFYLAAYALFAELRRGLRRSLVATALLFAPWSCFLVAQIGQGQFFRRSMSLPTMISELVWQLPFTSFPWAPSNLQARLPETWGPWLPRAAIVLSVAATLGALWVLWRRRKDERRAFDFLLAVSVLAPWLTLAGALVAPLFDLRYLSPYLVFPVLALACAPRLRVKLPVAILLALLWLEPLGFALTYPLSRRPDWPHVCTRVAGETVLIYERHAAPAFMHYCGKVCMIETIHDSPEQIDDQEYIDASLDRFADRETLYLLVQNDKIYDPNQMIVRRLYEKFPRVNLLIEQPAMQAVMLRFRK